MKVYKKNIKTGKVCHIEETLSCVNHIPGTFIEYSKQRNDIYLRATKALRT